MPLFHHISQHATIPLARARGFLQVPGDAIEFPHSQRYINIPVSLQDLFGICLMPSISSNSHHPEGCCEKSELLGINNAVGLCTYSDVRRHFRTMHNPQASRRLQSPHISSIEDTWKWSNIRHQAEPLFPTAPFIAEAISGRRRSRWYCAVSLVCGFLAYMYAWMPLNQRRQVIPSDPLEVLGFTDDKISAAKRIPPLQVLIHSRVRSHHASVLPYAWGRYSRGFQLAF